VNNEFRNNNFAQTTYRKCRAYKLHLSALLVFILMTSINAEHKNLINSIH